VGDDNGSAINDDARQHLVGESEEQLVGVRTVDDNRVAALANIERAPTGLYAKAVRGVEGGGNDRFGGG
jgi:hypothetical protein